MADNVAITAGTGTSIAADDIGAGLLVQRVKTTWGPDGTANDADVATGKPLPVQVRSATGLIPLGEPTDAKSTATDTTSVAVIPLLKQISASVQAPPSQAVTNAGTFAAQAAITAASGSIASGAVSSGAFASGALASGSVASGAIASGAIAAGAIAAGATSIADNEDAASADGDRGVKMLAVRKATPANTSGTDGDYEFLQMSAGRVWTSSDVTLAGSAAATGAGASGATVLRTTLASDSPGIITTGTAGTASSTVLTVQGIAGATPQPVGGVTVTQAASSTITRPADTTAYASGDLVANSTTAGSVTNLQFTTLARVSGGSGVIIGAQIQKSTNSVTNAAFRLHLFNTAPTYTSNGDNTAMTTVVVASAKGYLGYIDITAMVGFSDVAWGSGAPDNSRGGIPYVATAQIIYGLLEARGAYTPGNAEVFTVTVDALQD